MKNKWAVIFVFCLTGGANLFGAACLAQPLNLDVTLNEKIVMVPVLHGAPSQPIVTVSNAVSSGANPPLMSTRSTGPSMSPDLPVMLETTIFTPPGPGPFPIIIMNHGKSLGNPHHQERARFFVISKEFVKRGYAVVIPMRTGFAKSTGDYVEEKCNMTSNGNMQADDLQSVLNFTLQQSWADKNRILIAGQSYGGLTTIAFGTRNFPGVKGLINFAGGLRTSGKECDWQSSLIEAFASYGSKSSVPSIWFYGANDSYFNPVLASQLHDAYVRSGGQAKLVAFSAFKKDAHGMTNSQDGVKIWWPEVEKFLLEIGMPTNEQYSLPPEIKIQKTDYAALGNVNAVPYLKENGRMEYRTFLGKSLPRAFAISASGSWSWQEDGDNPKQSAIANCNKISREPCKLYAVDDEVVWSENPRKELH